MAQKVFPQWSPVVKALNEDQQEVYIPAAIIHAQTRDGEDELIVGAANMQFDPETGDYLPTHAGNPVEVRARALETLLQTLGKEETLALVKAALDVLVSKDFATQTTLAAVLEKLADLATELTLDGVKSAVDALAGTVDAGAQKVTLSGQKMEPVFPRAIRNGSTGAPTFIAPHWASGAIVFCHIYGVTGTFGEDQGLNLRVRNGFGSLATYTSLRLSDTTTPRKNAPGTLMVVIHPTQRNMDPPPSGPDVIQVIAPLGERLSISLGINGEFGVGEGFDCECSVFWMTA